MKNLKIEIRVVRIKKSNDEFFFFLRQPDIVKFFIKQNGLCAKKKQDQKPYHVKPFYLDFIM